MDLNLRHSLDLNLRHSIFRGVVFCLGSIKESVQKWYCASFAPKQINIQESEHNEGHTYAHSNRDHFAPSTTEKSIFNPLFQLCSRYLSTISSTIKNILQCQQTLYPYKQTKRALLFLSQLIHFYLTLLTVSKITYNTVFID